LDLVDKAIIRLQTASEMSLQVYGKPLIITDSGGKDSSVLVDLAIKAKIPIEIQHHHTTADAPETIYFVRSKFKQLETNGHICEITYPTYKGQRTSMWSLIPQKMMPPTRLARYCCDVLKEPGGKNRMIATGVRWAESNNRKANRGIYETLGSKRGDYIILANDNDDRRQLFENCQLKAKRVVNPIIDWTDSDVWNYIHSEKLMVNPLYDCGWKRVGCIGCPMAGRKGRLFEFSQYPKYENLYRLAFAKLVEARKARGKDDSGTAWETAESMFNWWMEDKNLDGQISLFDTE
jgi:3'-phosphoadenosine 5'-phosphosulfate sulfotransferase (PAPS reductase)/FAD synthetase